MPGSKSIYLDDQHEGGEAVRALGASNDLPTLPTHPNTHFRVRGQNETIVTFPSATSAKAVNELTNTIGNSCMRHLEAKHLLYNYTAF